MQIRKEFPKKVFDAIIADQLYNIKNIIIMNMKSSLLEASCGVYNHQAERREK